MADISDVEQALVELITDIMYPSGVACGSIVGTTCRIYRGWPSVATLNADLAAGTVNITIVSDNESGATTTRYLDDWQPLPRVPPLGATVSGSTVTITGTPDNGTVIGLLVDGLPYAYRCAEFDTKELVAAGLHAVIQAARPTSLTGTAITIPGASSLCARVAADATALYESRRQEKDIRIMCWCPIPDMRDSVSAAVDLAIAQRKFFPLPDQSSARIQYLNSSTYDQAQNALLYRRDLIYRVEYPTIVAAELPSMLFGGAGLNKNTRFG